MSKKLYAFIRDLTRRAGLLIIEDAKKDITAKIKEGVDIVTQTDIKVTELLDQTIKGSAFNYPILNEETYDPSLDYSEYSQCWVIDPVDGTTNFSKRIPRFCTSIALIKKGKTIAGGVYNPLTKEFFYAEQGSFSFCNSVRIHVSSINKLTNAVICIDSSYLPEKQRNRGAKLYQTLCPPITRGIRQFASAALDLCDVATGKFDAYIAPSAVKFSGWDFAAAGLILEKAGGKFTDHLGNRWTLKLYDRLASNRLLHLSLIKKLRKIQ